MCSTTVFGRAGSIHDRRLRKANVGTALPAQVAPHATDTWTVIHQFRVEQLTQPVLKTLAATNIAGRML